jgi:alpha-ribazole phosphatase
MEIYLIRHTTPEIEKGICYGQSDLPVALSFADEFARLRLHLPDTFDTVYASPLQRCQQLALRLHTNTLINDSRLMEMNFGDWELRKWDEIPASQLDVWMKDFVQVPAPNGENFATLSARAGQFYDELKVIPGQKTAIVSHAGVIRALLAKVLELPLRNAFKLPVSYGSVTKLHMDPVSCHCNLEYLNRG